MAASQRFVLDAETGERISVNFGDDSGEIQESLLSESTRRKWAASEVRKEIIGLKKQKCRFMLEVLEEAKAREQTRQIQMRLEKDPDRRKKLREKFNRERKEARAKIERIASEHKLILASRLVEHNLLR